MKSEQTFEGGPVESHTGQASFGKAKFPGKVLIEVISSQEVTSRGRMLSFKQRNRLLPQVHFT